MFLMGLPVIGTTYARTQKVQHKAKYCFVFFDLGRTAFLWIVRNYSYKS